MGALGCSGRFGGKVWMGVLRTWWLVGEWVSGPVVRIWKCVFVCPSPGSGV
jgi:hypothetical protein